MQVLICSEDKKAPDTKTGIAYQVLFEQRLPLLDKAVDPNNIAETIATILMLNSFEHHIRSNNTLFKETFDNKTSVEQKLTETKTIALKKIKTEIDRIIDEDIIKVVEKQSNLFSSHGKKGLIGKAIDNAKGWFAKKLSRDKKALNDYKDFEFRHVSPAYTDAAPGLLKNNLEFLYEEICNIVLASRKVGDLFALYVFFNEQKTNFLDSKIQHIQTSNQKLQETLNIYIKELEKQSFETKNDLLFFAQKYQVDAGTILQTICTYLNEVAKNATAKATQKKIVAPHNIQDFLTFFILPSSFLDTDVVDYTNYMASNIEHLQKKQNQYSSDLALAVKDKLAAQQKNAVLLQENQNLKTEIDRLQKALNIKSSTKGDTKIPLDSTSISYTSNIAEVTAARTELLVIQKTLDNAKNITAIEKAKMNFDRLQKPDNNQKADVDLYNTIQKSIQTKIDEYKRQNITELSKAEEKINKATTLNELTDLENTIKELNVSADLNSADSKKHAEITNQLKTKKTQLQEKK